MQWLLDASPPRPAPRSDTSARKRKRCILGNSLRDLETWKWHPAVVTPGHAPSIGRDSSLIPICWRPCSQKRGYQTSLCIRIAWSAYYSSRISDSVGQGWGQRNCISSMFPGWADDAGSETTWRTTVPHWWCLSLVAHYNHLGSF